MKRALRNLADFVGFAVVTMKVSSHVGAGRYDEAIALVEGRTGLDAMGVYAHGMMALCCDGKGDEETAVFHASRVLVANPYDSASLKRVATYYLQRKNYDAVYHCVLRYLHVPEVEEDLVPSWMTTALRLVGLRRLADKVHKSIEQSNQNVRDYVNWAISFRDWYERGRKMEPPVIH